MVCVDIVSALMLLILFIIFTMQNRALQGRFSSLDRDDGPGRGPVHCRGWRGSADSRVGRGLALSGYDLPGIIHAQRLIQRLSESGPLRLKPANALPSKKIPPQGFSAPPLLTSTSERGPAMSCPG